MIALKRPFDNMACDLTGFLTTPSSKVNSYVLTCMYLLTNFPLAVLIPDIFT